MAATVEEVLDVIAQSLVESSYYGTPTKVRANQKTVKEGVIDIGRSNSDKLILYQKDTKANLEDLNRIGVGGFVDGLTLVPR